MSEHNSSSNSTEAWSQHAKVYDPTKIGSIDGTDTEPHDRGIVRAINSEYCPNRHVKGKPECTIFVARLSPKTTKDTIRDIFSKFGRLKRFRLVKDIVTGTPKGYAFIEYESERAAEDAYRKANKMYLDGQAIFVDFECERLLKGWKPRRLGGGFGGRKESGQLRFGGRDRPFHKPISLEIQERHQSERERRDREYRSHRHRDSSEERHKRSRERDEDKGHRYNLNHRHRSRERRETSKNRDEHRSREHRETSKHRDRHRSRERRETSKNRDKHRSQERRETSKNRDEHRKNKNCTERRSLESSENSCDQDINSKSSRNLSDNRNGKS